MNDINMNIFRVRNFSKRASEKKKIVPKSACFDKRLIREALEIEEKNKWLWYNVVKSIQ